MARRQKTIYLNNSRRRRRPRNKKAVVAMVIGASALIAVGVSFLPNGYRIIENGEVIGVVKEKEFIDTALETLQVQLEDTYKTKVKIDPIDEVKAVRVASKEMMDPNQLPSYLRENLAIELEFQQLSIDGEVVGIVESKDIEDELKTELKRKYFDDISVRAEFTNEIDFEPVFATEADLIPLDDLVDICSKRDRQIVTYEIQPGDSLFRISANLGCNITDILKVNEGMTETTPLKIGESIKAEVRIPLLGLELIQLPEPPQEETPAADAQPGA